MIRKLLSKTTSLNLSIPFHVFTFFAHWGLYIFYNLTTTVSLPTAAKELSFLLWWIRKYCLHVQDVATTLPHLYLASWVVIILISEFPRFPNNPLKQLLLTTHLLLQRSDITTNVSTWSSIHNYKRTIRTPVKVNCSNKKCPTETSPPSSTSTFFILFFYASSQPESMPSRNSDAPLIQKTSMPMSKFTISIIIQKTILPPFQNWRFRFRFHYHYHFWFPFLFPLKYRAFRELVGFMSSSMSMSMSLSLDGSNNPSSEDPTTTISIEPTLAPTPADGMSSLPTFSSILPTFFPTSTPLVDNIQTSRDDHDTPAQSQDSEPAQRSPDLCDGTNFVEISTHLSITTNANIPDINVHVNGILALLEDELPHCALLESNTNLSSSKTKVEKQQQSSYYIDNFKITEHDQNGMFTINETCIILVFSISYSLISTLIQ